MIDVVILAGGFGTRLQKTVSDVPKALAPIGERPFLDILLTQLKKSSSFDRMILALGYKADLIQERVKNENNIDISIEKTPLGTGGALLLALDKTDKQTVCVVNGDTFFDIDFDAFYTFHREKKSNATLAVRYETQDGTRYGKLAFDANKQIRSFEEKKGGETGWVSGGIYLIEKNALQDFSKGKPYSLEKDFFPSLLSKNMFAYESRSTFIDIGTPESYESAQHLSPLKDFL